MSNIRLIEEFGDAWNKHDLVAAMSFVDEQCVFESTGPAPDGRRYAGIDEVRAAWKPIFEDESSLFEVEDVFDADDRVVQCWRYSWSGGHIRGVDVMKVRDGKITEKFSYVKG